jgi:asparagine synthase (glutamine-hydrolysing)
VGFRNKAYDETSLARLTANKLGLTLHEVSGDVFRYSETAIHELLYHYGQPFGDTSSIPTRVLARSAKEHFTVALSGDGGDELFCGYLSFRRLAQLNRYGMGEVGRTVSRNLSRRIPQFSAWEPLRRAMDLNSSIDFGLFGYAFEGVFDDSQILDLVRGTEWEVAGREFLADKRAETSDRWARTKDPFLALSLHLLATSFPQQMLMKMDRMSMAESLEVRSPFLDSRVASYALSLPTHIKMHGLVGKAMLRECLADRIPRAVLCAPKRGFQLPLRDWLGDAFRRDLEFEINEYERDSVHELNLTALKAIVRNSQAAEGIAANFRSIHRLWLVFVYLRWRRTWCKQWTRASDHSSDANTL